MQPAVGSTIESTGTGCSTAAMTSERRADETQVVTGCARGPDKGSRLGLGTLGAAHSPDKTLPSRSGSGGRAPSRSGFFALYHPSEPSPAQPEQNLPRENPCCKTAAASAAMMIDDLILKIRTLTHASRPSCSRACCHRHRALTAPPCRPQAPAAPARTAYFEGIGTKMGWPCFSLSEAHARHACKEHGVWGSGAASTTPQRKSPQGQPYTH